MVIDLTISSVPSADKTIVTHSRTAGTSDDMHVQHATPGTSSELSSRAPTPTTTRKKRKNTEIIDEALSVVVNEMKTVQDVPKADWHDNFGAFIAYQLKDMTEEQRDFCTGFV